MAVVAGEIPRVRTHASEAASEAAFALLDSLWMGPIGLALLDRDLRVRQVNERLAAAARLPSDDPPGRPLGDLLVRAGFGDEDRARVEEALRDVVEHGRPHARLAVPALLDAQRREWRCSAYPVLGPDAALRGACMVIAEATALEEREAVVARADEAALRAAARLALQQDLAAALSAAVEPADVARAVAERLGPLAGSAAVLVRRLREGRLERIALAGTGELFPFADPIPLDAALPAATAARRAQPVFLERLEDAGFPPALLEELRARGRGAMAALPLVVAGRVLGTLSLVFSAPRRYDLEERAFLRSVADQCAGALDRALLHEAEREGRAALEREADRLARLQAVAAALSGARTAAEVAAAAIGQLDAALGIHTALVHELEPGGEWLRLLGAGGYDARERAPLARLRLDAELPLALAARTGVARYLPDVGAELGAWPALAAVGKRAVLRGALAAVPLHAGGRLLGTLAVGFDAPVEFDDGTRDLLGAVAALLAQALERAQLFDAEETARAGEAWSRAQLDGLLESAPVGLGLWDTSFRFLKLNRMLAEMNGLPVDAHLGKTPREVLPGIAGLDELEALWRRILATGEPALEVPLQGETPARPGRVRHWTESFFPVRAEGEVLGVGAVVREVTTEREAEEFQRQVLGIVGHDLRTPLSTVVLAAHALALQPLPPEIRPLTARVERAAARIETIVGVLLDYTRVRAGEGIPIRRAPGDLAGLAREVAEEAVGARPGREVRVLGEPSCPAAFDRDRLGQVLQNLFANACDHGAPGEPVHVTVATAGDEVVVEVRNRGTPIPADVLPVLFEPFRRGEAGPRGDGLGLGLFIARAIVEAHGGRIEARSGEGDTCFAVRLPRAARGPGVGGAP